MPTITKAATPLRMPKYWIPKTTWYRKRATRQLRPMLAIPKKDRNTGQGKKHREWSGGTQENTAFQCLWPQLGPASYTAIPRGTFTTPSEPSIVLYTQRRCWAGGLSSR